ncbi:MAG: DUF1365 domain-containing protein [Rubrivivax sp.]|nr:DUF1365 domain-containing protein [Rubrivivax sp.]
MSPQEAPSPTSEPAAPAAALVIGTVRHARLRPVHHEFTYPTFCVLLPMRSWSEGVAVALARNRRGWVSFHDRDHGDGGSDSLAWLQRLLAEHGVRDADGEVWLQTYPRVLGFVFKPVSFWFCHRADGSLRAVVAEVNNTFGERHCYLLDDPQVGWGRTLQADKAMHVSPFFPVSGGYRFRFARTAGRLVSRVEHFDSDGTLLVTSVSGTLAPLDTRGVRAALLRMPLLTLGVVARIHWQALRLWLKRVPFHRKPPAPRTPVTGLSANAPVGPRPPALRTGAHDDAHPDPHTDRIHALERIA